MTKCLSVCLLVAAIVMTLSASAQKTMVGNALAELRESPPISPESFDFVVIGDTRSTQPVELPEEFKQAISEFNILKPAFVVDIGDLILGGDAGGIGPQWDEFERVVGSCRVPFIPGPGNHDISDAGTERIYLERIGHTRFAFDYGNSLFVMLNSEEIGAVDRLSEEQNTWLQEQLESTGAKNIFLFIHKPYFAADSPALWKDTAAVLEGHPVKVVFGSHWHLYRDCGAKDGIRYVVTGGGGAERRVPESEGGFCHYLLVRVRGEEVGWSVIKPGAILPEDVMTDALLKEIRAMKEALWTEPLEAPYGQSFDRDVTVFVRNPFEHAIESALTWNIPDGWSVSPPNKPYAVQPGQTAQLRFRIAAAGPEAARFPVPHARTVFEKIGAGKPIEAARRIDLIPAIPSMRAVTPVTVDGTLGEWVLAEPVLLSYAWGFDINDTADLKADIRLMWDGENLYLAVEVEDDEFHQPYAGDIVWSADGIQLFLDDWEWGLTLTSAGPEVFLYAGVNRESETVNHIVQLAVRRDGRRTTYEAAFPASEVAPLELEAGNSCRLCVVVNDLDPSVPERPRHWAELTPGPGDAVPGAPMAKIILRE